jgi:transcriptional regulator with XRE-family HTH domain
MLFAMTDDIRTERDVDPVRKQIGDNVRAEMARLGLNQDDLGRILDVGRSQISRRLTGVIGFEAAELVRLAAEFGVPVARLAEVPAPAVTA